MSKSLVLLIHGLGGDGTTWGRLPELLRTDADVAARFDVADPYTFSTSLAGHGPGIADLAKELATSLELPPISAYPSVVLVAHSMGGLVAKRVVADALIAGKPPRVVRIVTFGSPLLGAGGASALSRVPGAGPQHRDLAIGSAFVNALGHDWAATGADRQVSVQHVIAGDDSLVGAWSATAGYRHATYYTLRAADHKTIVKPANAQAESFKLLRKLLLDSCPPWHRAPDQRHYEQPVLDGTTFSDSSLAPHNVARFHYRSRSLPFFGREREWAALATFMGGTDPFRWMVVSGAGGVGKSRLALELCLAASGHCYAGFLPESERARAWDRWQPLAPTLMVLDYATRNTQQARALLHGLARRTMPGAAYPLGQPVRVLLLIRPGDERSLADDVVNRGDAVVAVKHTGAQDYLALAALKDPWPVFEAVFRHAGKSLPDRASTLKALERIDHERRPLFAFLLADAMARAADGSPAPRNLDRRRLLEDVIERWRAQFWRPAYEAQHLGNGTAEEVLLALATMCGGVSLQGGRSPETNLEGFLPAWRPHAHPIVFTAMTGKPSREVVPALEPDIVGEHFVVSLLSKFSEHEQSNLIDLAWRLDPPAAAAFIDRVSQDIDHTSENAAALAALWRKPGKLSDEASLFRAALGCNLLWHLASRVPSIVEPLLAELKVYADTLGEPRFWAVGAYNVLHQLSTRDPEPAVALLAEMKACADTRGRPLLRELWAMGAVKVLQLCRRDQQTALLTEMKAHANTHGDDALRRLWGEGAFNVLFHLRTLDPQAALALLAEMKTYADTHAEASLREHWSSGAVNVLADLSRRDPQAALALLAEMKVHADSHGEVPLRELWAKGARNVLGDLVTRDLQAALALLAEMKACADIHGDAPVREDWANAAVNILIDLRTRDPRAALCLLAEMKACADAHGEVALRELWANGAVNVLNGPCKRDQPAALALLAEMKACADMHGEAPLRKLWAVGAFNVLLDLRMRDQPAALALLAEMKVHADSHGEAPLRELWAKARSTSSSI